MTKKQVNELDLKFGEPIVVQLKNNQIIGGFFRQYKEYFIFVNRKRIGMVLEVEELKRIRKVICINKIEKEIQI